MDQKKLAGVITDGDIRRAVLSGYSIDDPVTKIYNTAPFYIIEHLRGSNLLEIKKRCPLPTVCSTRQGRMRWPARKKIRIPGSGI